MLTNESELFEQVYPSSLDASRQAAEALNEYWSKIGVSPGLATQLELCIVEMVNNAYIHAYKEVEGKDVTVRCQLTQESNKANLSLEVLDEGESMTSNDFQKAMSNDFLEADPSDESTWETSGRGFLIVSSLMDEVTLSSEQGINRFVLTKQLEESELMDTTLSS
ncbi:ATP-binding protein [Vibrio sp. TBV020]|uniref:ATP-binding protein n=1 Tax=Vibrio sp. TBV020 TaxID=3137398 RepID=UPI0038CD87E4